MINIDETPDKTTAQDQEQIMDASEKETLNTENTQAETQNAEVEATVAEPTWEAKYNELNDKYMRLVAEYDNYRRRTLKERMDLIKSAGEDILVNILPVVDNVERAQKSMQNAKEIEPVKEGINLIHKTFVDFLTRRGVKEMEAQGKDFDADIHEALTKIPAPQAELSGKVVDVIEKGYLLNEKVIRFAKVVVGE